MKKHLLILALVGLLVYCLAFQGKRGLWEPDEGRYTSVAMEMLRTGDWLVPHLHHEQPHWTKPPLTYWAIAVSIHELGRTPFAARLPSTLAFFLTTCLVYLLSGLFLKDRTWLSPLVYASFLMPAVSSNIITTDGLLTLFETAAIFAYARAVWGKNKKSAPAWMLAMWCAFGLAFLTKGPPGLLPFTAIIAHRLWLGKKAGLPRLQYWPGLLIGLGVGLSWFALVIAHQPDLMRYFLVHEVYGRVITGEFNRNSQWYKAFVIYLPVLLIGTIPWGYWLWRYGFNRIRTLYASFRQPLNRDQSQDLFLLFWFLGPLLILMLSSSRLPLYLLPLFAPLALLTARGLETSFFIWTRSKFAWTAAWCLLLVGLRVIAAEVPYKKDAAPLARSIRILEVKPFTEIIFYETDPIRGLNIYLDKEIEEITLKTLDDELGEGEEALWVMPPNHVPSFLESVARRGLKFRQVGKIDRRYLIFQETTDRDN